jgi:oligoendopeptidase F
MTEDGHKEMLSASEEQDLEALLKSTDLTITDIDELSSKLTSQLTRLELENVDGLIESESAVQDVIKRLEEASLELGAVDTWLNYYNSQLTNMRQYIEHIEAKNNSM